MSALLQQTRSLIKALSLILLCLGSSLSHANWRAQIPNIEVIGQGDLTFLGFRVYTARLLGTSSTFSSERPFALQLTYHRSISRDDLVEASLSLMSRQQGKTPTPQQLDNWQTQMQQAFVDVELGQQIIGVFLPGKGCKFYVGDQLRYEIADPVFAEAFFAIWLAPDTTEPELREQLLGKS